MALGNKIRARLLSQYKNFEKYEEAEPETISEFGLNGDIPEGGPSTTSLDQSNNVNASSYLENQNLAQITPMTMFYPQQYQ